MILSILSKKGFSCNILFINSMQNIVGFKTIREVHIIYVNFMEERCILLVKLTFAFWKAVKKKNYKTT